jgi:hypothetical protein
MNIRPMNDSIMVSFDKDDWTTGVAKECMNYLKTKCSAYYNGIMQSWKVVTPTKEQLERIKEFHSVNDMSLRVCVSDCPEHEVEDFLKMFDEFP